MQFTILGLALAAVSFANAAAIQARGGEYYSGGSGIPVCPADQSALCCQLDVDGVIDTSCESAGTPGSIAAFEATCAATGRTAECCELAIGTDALLCVEA